MRNRGDTEKDRCKATGFGGRLRHSIATALVVCGSAGFGVSANAALSINATLDREQQEPGTNTLVGAVITNDGSSVETGIEIRTSVPSGLQAIAESLVGGPLDAAASCATDSGSSSACTANESLVWTLGALAPGQAFSVSFPAVINTNETVGTTYDFEFTLSQNSAVVVSSTASMTATASTVLDLSVVADESPAAVGSEVRYTLNYGNRSATTATSASLALTLPTSVTFISATGGGIESADQVTWNLGSLPAGAIAQQQVVVSVDSQALGTALPVSAQINGIASSLPTSQTTTEAGYVGLGSPLELAVALNSESVAPGEQLLVEMVVANSSASTVFGGSVALRLPKGLNAVAESLVDGPVDADASCANDAGSSSACTTNEYLIFALGNLPAGRAINLSFPVTATNAASNPAGSNHLFSVAVGDDGGALETEGVALQLGSAPLNLSIDTDRSPAAAAQSVAYTVHYGNSELENLTNAELSVRLPEGTTVTNISGSGVLTNGVLNWTLGSLPAGATGKQSATFVLPATADAGALLQTEALLSGLIASLPAAQRTSQATVIGAGSPLQLALSINPNPVTPGTQNLVELLATNPGGSTVFGGVIRLRQPTRVNAVAESLVDGQLDADASCANDAGSSSACTANEFFEFALNNLAPGEAARFSLPMSVFSSTNAGELVPWRAIVSDDSGAFNSRSQTLPVVTGNALNLAIDDDIDPVIAGNPVSYVLSYGNASGSSLASSTLTFELPADTNFVSATGNGQLNGGAVSWDLGSLLDETIARQTVVVTTNAMASSGSLLRANAELSGTIDSQPATKGAFESGYVGPGSELAMELLVTPDPAVAGAEVSIDVTVSNPTTDLVPGVRVALRHPSGFSPISEALVEGPFDADQSCANDSGSSSVCTTAELFVWDLGNVAPGQTTELRVPAAILTTLSDGNQIGVEATLADDSNALTTESQTLQLGTIAPAGPIGASLLPVSRSVQVGQTATAFASIVNTSVNPAFDCSIAPATSVPATFSFQATDAATNGAIGAPNSPVEIPGGASQSFVFAFTPNAAFAPTEIALTFDCSNSDPAPIFAGVNTLLLSADANPIPDVIGLTTTTDLQVLVGNTTLFAVGSANVGSTGAITVSVDDGGANLPLSLLLCETDPATGGCSGPIGATATLNYAAGATASFAVFVDTSSSIDFSPATNRVFIRFTDATGVVRGATSTSVRTQ